MQHILERFNKLIHICYVKFTLREKLDLTNTPGLVQIIEKSFRHRNNASEISQGQFNTNEKSTQAQL